MAFAGKFDTVLPPRAAIRANRSGTPRSSATASDSIQQPAEPEPEPEPEQEPEPEPEIDTPRVVFCLGVVSAMVLLAAADLVHIDVGVLVVSLMLIGTGCITVEEALGAM